MIPVVISGLGQCSALGQGMDKLRQAALDDIGAESKPEMVKTVRGEIPVPVLRVPQLVVPKLLPEAVERRMSRFAKMCFVTAAEAMEDAGIMRSQDPERTAMVVGTAFGNLDLANTYQRRILRDGAAGASPSMFAASIHNSIASQLTLSFGIRGPNSTVATMEQTAFSSLRLAYDWIQTGFADRVVLLMGDEISEYHLYYFAHLDGRYTAGEGMTCLVLERQDQAKKAYARVLEPSLTSEQIAAQNFRAGAGRDTHGHLYGGTLMGAAFELALAALAVERTSAPVAVSQVCRGLPSQSVVLTGI